MLKSASLSYANLRKYFETKGFKFNPYDPCVANKITEGEPLTILFHIDDVKAIKKDTMMVENFERWVYFMYEYPSIGKVKSVRRNSMNILPRLYITPQKEK